jgi:hypothetical protein
MGAVLESSWWEDSPCLRCIVPHMICCMPEETTETAAITIPKVLTSMSVTVLRGFGGF